MPLRRRLLGLSAAVSGGFRCSLSTANSHPPWAMMSCRAAVVGSLTADVCLAEPPHVSELRVPKHLIKTRGSPDPDSDVLQSFSGAVSAASGDGLLFLSYLDLRFTAPVVSKQGARRVRLQPTGLDPTHLPKVTRFVCNPLTRELSRLPDFVSNPVGDILCGPHMGLLTQADRGQGPPDRFALAVLHENLMLRFLSETEEWQALAVSPCQLPLARRMKIDQEPLAFGGRLWWVDVTWGAISADPFSDRPELCFVELPRGSVLPAGAQDEAFRRGRTLPDAEGNVWWKQAPARYRLMGVSEERLRYVEVSQKEPFLLSSFALDDEGSGWTLEYRVALSKLWADGGYPWLPLQEGKTPQIGLLDPLNANVVYLTVDDQAVVGVDMDRKEVIGGHLSTRDSSFIPCVLPPWLGSCSIPSAGKMDDENNETLADVLVRSEIP